MHANFNSKIGATRTSCTKMIQELDNLIEYDGNTCLDATISVAGPITDGSVVIHHLLSTFVRSQHRVIFLSLSQAYNHFQAVAQKLGTNLAHAKTSGRLSHIDGLSFSLDTHHQESDGGKSTILGRCGRCRSLRPLYEDVRSLIAAHRSADQSSTVCVVIDDLSTLLSLGFSAKQLSEFVHYLRVDLNKISGNFVALVHKDPDSEELTRLASTISYGSMVLIHVGGLASGHSKDVHGTMTVTHLNNGDNTPARREPKHVHYKILDKTVSIFPIGTAVL